MRLKWVVFLCMIQLLFVPVMTYGAELEDYDFTGVQEVVDEALSADSMDFVDLIKSLVQGKLSDFPTILKDFLWDKVWREIDANRAAIIQVIMIAAAGAIFTNFSNIFSKSQISETGFYITYLLLITVLTAAFTMAGIIAKGVIENLLNFMKAVMPSYFIAAAFAGGSATSIAFYEFTLALVSLVQWLLLKGMIPLVNIYMMLKMVNFLSKDSFLSKLLELLKSVIDWTLKTLLALVIGYNAIQSMILPFADSIKTTAVGKVIQAIPGIGQGVNSVTDIVLGAGVLIKNGIGTAAFIFLVLIAAVPALKLVVITILYKGAAAAMQPISDKRLISCIDSVAEGSGLLLRIVGTALLLFLITIGVICSSTNVNYFAGG